MTLLNIVRQKECIHLLTDGAGLNDRGLVGSILSKAMVYPHLNMAIGFRGIHQVGMILMSSFSTAKSFDDLCPNIGGILKSQVDAIKASHDKAIRKNWFRMLGPSGLEFDIALVGWHQKRGPTGIFVSSINRPGTPAFRVVDVNELITPSNDELFKQVAPVFGSSAFDVERDMIAVAEKQRLINEPYGPRQIQSSRVGGFLSSRPSLRTAFPAR